MATIATVETTLAQITTIQIKGNTKRRLQKLGNKGDTYDEVIRKLINRYTKSTESRSGTE